MAIGIVVDVKLEIFERFVLKIIRESKKLI